MANDLEVTNPPQTALQILARLLTVDGAGSGLDADLLDGQQGAYYLAMGNMTGTANVSQGGTGLSSVTAGRILVGNGTSALNSYSTLTFDGSNFFIDAGLSVTGPTKLGSNGTIQGYLKIYNASSPNAEGNIYNDSTYAVRIDTNSNARPIRIDGSRLDISSPVVLGADLGGSGILRVGAANAASASMRIENTSSGASEYAQFVLAAASGQSTTLYQFSSGYATTGRYIQGSYLIEAAGAGGLSLATTAATNIRFYTNGSNLRGYFESGGALVLGTDLGGSELLRVGGSAKATSLVVQAASPFIYLDRTVGGNAAVILLRDTTATQYNWLTGVQYNIDNGYEITASSTVNGNTYNQNLFACLYNGVKKLSFFGATPLAQTSLAAATGTATRTTFDTTTVTTAQLAERVKALIDDLRGYGLEG